MNESSEFFRQAMQQAGIEPPAEIIPDGNLHRFNVAGDKPGTKNGWFVLYGDDPAAGAFGDWRQNISGKWCGKSKAAMTSEEKVNYTAKLNDIHKQREAERKGWHDECRKKSVELWQKGRDVDAKHPYVVAKKIRPFGAKQLRDNLLVPVCNSKGEIQGLQFIMPNGDKKFKLGTPTTGNFFLLGKPKDKILVCEGYATGCTLHEVTGEAVVIAFNAGNLKAVAEAIKEKFADATIVICADDDHATDGNPGITKATEAAKAVGGLLAIPSFKGDRKSKDTDFNDLARLSGAEAVNACIENAEPILEEKPKPTPTIADTLIGLAGKGVDFFFQDQYDTPYAYFPVNDHFEHWPVRSKSFRNWLQRLYFQSKGRGANSDAMNQALDTIEAMAQFDGKGKIELHNRSCQHDGAFWYDLTNDQWQSIRITESGWQIINNPPVMFRRLTHQKPQVIPDKSGTLDALNPFLAGIKDEKHKALIKIWLVTCFLPDFPHVILVPYGEQGSGKSSLAKFIKSIVDPSQTDALGIIGDYRELVQNLSHHWLLDYDNLSSLSREAQNIFCRAVTGAAYSKRKLYTDDDDILTYTRNCLILSGINYPATAPDLLDRCILIELRSLSKTGTNVKEEILNQKFQEAIPSILGGILDILVAAIQIKKTVSLDRLPRMIDWSEWGYCIAEAIGSGGQSFLDAYRENIGLRNQEIISSNPVASTLVNFMGTRKDKWEGTPSELLNGLTQLMPEDEKKDRSWPKTANVLVRRLNELKANLHDAGIEIEERRSGKERVLEITAFQQVGKNTVTTVTTVIPEERQQVTNDDNVTISDDTKKIPSQPNLLKTHHNDDNDDNDDKIPHLLEKGKNAKKEVSEYVSV